MTERKPGKTDFALHSSPWFPGGKTAEIKYSYSVSGLTPSGYPIRVRSKVPNRNETGINYRAFPNVDQQDPHHTFFRDFLEYDYLRDNEVMVTIEHCDQCHEHSDKTHHDPHKYAAFAAHIKTAVLSRYPMVKVLVKPLSALDGKFAYQRMGCFEVQVCCKFRGTPRKDQLHSKLSTRSWPNTDDILRKLADYLPTCQLFVTVYDETASQTATLKGLKVILRPKAVSVTPLLLQKSRPQSAQVNSTRSRPRSASSNASHQTHLTERSAVQSAQKPRALGRVMEQLTDREGCCTFQNLPMDEYEVEVCESRDYGRTVKQLNTLEEGQGAASFNMYVGVRPRGIAAVTVRLIDRQLNTLVPNAQVRLVAGSGDVCPLPERERGTYSSETQFGEYLLVISAAGYQDVKFSVLVDQSDFKVDEEMRQKEHRKAIVCAFDACSGTPLQGVHLNLRVNQSRMGMEGLTREEGEHVFSCEDTGQMTVEAVKPKYLSAYVDQTVLHRNDFAMNIGMVEVATTEMALAVVSWNNHSDDVEFQVETPAGVQTCKNPESQFCQLYDHLRTCGVSCALVSPACKAWVRLRVELLAAEYTQLSGFPSALQSTGLSVSVYHNNKLLATVTPPCMAGRYWEVGALNASLGEFVELNVLLPDKLQHYDDRVNDFIEVAEWVRLSSSPLSSLFCFDQSGVLRTTETGKEKVISSEILKRAFSNSVRFQRDDSADLILSGLKNTQGAVSLSAVKRRYDRYKREGRNALFKAQTIENYARLLGMDPMVDSEFLPLAEEGLRAPLPEPWETLHDPKGDLKYRNKLTGDIVSDHPNDAIYREKFLQAKRNRPPSAIEEAPREMEVSSENPFRAAEECLEMLNAHDMQQTKSEEVEELAELVREILDQLDALADNRQDLREQALQLSTQLRKKLKSLLSAKSSSSSRSSSDMEVV